MATPRGLQSKKERVFEDLTALCQFFQEAEKHPLSALRAKYHRLASLETATDELFEEIHRYNESVSNRKDEVSTKERHKFLDLIDTIRTSYFKIGEDDHREMMGRDRESVSRTVLLPKLQLPQFGGSIEDWLQFQTLFESLVHKNAALTPEQKFHYLKSNLKGEAAATISSFSLSPENYSVAYETLKSRYQSSRRLANYYLQLILKFKGSQPLNPQKFLNIHEVAINSLKLLEINNLADFLLFQLAYNNLDTATQQSLDLKIGETNEVPTANQLIEYVRIVARTEELKKDVQPKSNFMKESRSALMSSPTTEKVISSCSHCGESHFVAHCKKFKLLTPANRLEFFKGKNLCFNCLGPHHRQNCLSSKLCFTCKGKHHTLLHQSFNIESVSSNISQKDQTILLGTATIGIQSKEGPQQLVRALIDQGSEVSFISEALAQRLCLKREKGTVYIRGIGDTKTTVSRGIAQIVITSRLNQSFTYPVSAFILSKLTSYTPKGGHPAHNLETFQNLKLADLDPFSSKPIEVILGADIFAHIIQQGLQKSSDGALIAQNTTLGWMISGAVSQSAGKQITSLQCTLDVEFTQLINQFFGQENCPIERKSPTQEEIERTNFYRRTTERGADGRYTVRLPFKQEPSCLGDSKSAAHGSLRYLMGKLNQDSSLCDAYNRFLEEYQELHHMKKIDDVEDFNQAYYLPHHGVWKESSSTTKLRVVFNASRKTSTGISLNEILHSGPSFLPSLVDLVCRWRKHRIVFSRDIEKMYRQIWMNERDQQYQRILWKRPNEQKIDTYELQTVTYGTACAPFLAIYTLHRLADDERESFPIGSETLKNDTYVDDILSGADDENQALEKQTQLIQLLKAGGFNARKWTSNSKRLIEHLSNDMKATSTTLSWNSDTYSMLGLNWDATTDAFQFKIDLKELPKTITKRISLWLLKLDWDDDLPEKLADRWNHLYHELSGINLIQIPRWIGFSNKHNQYELHAFADASEVAYAAVIYLKSFGVEEEGKVSIVLSKSRVAPLQSISLPRLELCAAVLAAKLSHHISVELNIQSVPIHLWTDSNIVLHWITNHPSKWKTYIANRVTTIQTLVPLGKWHHVPSKDNPADCASREENDLLHRYSSLNRLLRVSAYCLRFIAKCKHAPTNPSLTLSSTELNLSDELWIKVTQRLQFSQEISALAHRLPLPSSSKLLKLSPFLDESGLLRVGGRLDNAQLPYNHKHPYILPQNSHYTTLVIKQNHLKTLPGGLSLTLFHIRQRYWILQGRRTVKTFIGRCIKCLRYRGYTMQQQMANLPITRVTPTRPFLNIGIDYAGPLLVTPIRRRGQRSHKAFVALFICLVTKAVHIELVSNYSAEAFLGAFRRFTSRRGLCSSIISDNGTNFVGACKELRQLLSQATREGSAIATELANANIIWKFNPPSAPHFGGIWEAAIKSAKSHIKKVIGDTLLSYEEMATLLTQVEAILNSRPLTPLRDDLESLEVLTPGHFLIGDALLSIPEPNLTT